MVGELVSVARHREGNPIMVDRGDSADSQLAFFAVRRTHDEQGYIGAILVTDSRGIPAEFRCTHPVKPSSVQRALYGGNLESYISIDLCGKPLVGSLTSKPLVCLVESAELVSLRDIVDLPILHAQRSANVLVEAHGMDKENGLRVIDMPSPNAEPLTIICHPDWTQDLGIAKVALERASHHVDLLEPFERISTSLTILAERDNRFK